MLRDDERLKRLHAALAYAAVLTKALDGIIHELAQSVPWLVIEVPQDSQHTDTGRMSTFLRANAISRNPPRWNRSGRVQHPSVFRLRAGP